jgi:hypothetical protein
MHTLGSNVVSIIDLYTSVHLINIWHLMIWHLIIRLPPQQVQDVISTLKILLKTMSDVVSRKVGRHQRGTQRSRLLDVDMTLHACCVGCVTVSVLAQNAHYPRNYKNSSIFHRIRTNINTTHRLLIWILLYHVYVTSMNSIRLINIFD